jgi:hypothetical protein
LIWLKREPSFAAKSISYLVAFFQAQKSASPLWTGRKSSEKSSAFPRS